MPRTASSWSAAPGSGKTSLLSERHGDTREHRSFAWISLNAADNDPVRFWDGVFAALQTTAPAIGGSAPAALHSPGTTVTVNTIKTHACNIYRKLGVAERADAISRARELSLI